jgi:hypothetical protein
LICSVLGFKTLLVIRPCRTQKKLSSSPSLIQ